jgi:hypothetical protein
VHDLLAWSESAWLVIGAVKQRRQSDGSRPGLSIWGANREPGSSPGKREKNELRDRLI